MKRMSTQGKCFFRLFLEKNLPHDGFGRKCCIELLYLTKKYLVKKPMVVMKKIEMIFIKKMRMLYLKHFITWY